MSLIAMLDSTSHNERVLLLQLLFAAQADFNHYDHVWPHQQLRTKNDACAQR
jgi:hypothetical protein